MNHWIVIHRHSLAMINFNTFINWLTMVVWITISSSGGRGFTPIENKGRWVQTPA